MSTSAEILDALKTQLEDDATLSAYVKNIYLGARENMTSFPLIFIEPVNTLETEERYGVQTVKLRAQIIGYIETMNKDMQIYGDAAHKGILDFENDIKKAIDYDRTLDGHAIHSSFVKESTYDIIAYPLRAVGIEIEILFEQLTNVRT
jgi:hypothetical protein